MTTTNLFTKTLQRRRAAQADAAAAAQAEAQAQEEQAAREEAARKAAAARAAAQAAQQDRDTAQAERAKTRELAQQRQAARERVLQARAARQAPQRARQRRDQQLQILVDLAEAMLAGTAPAKVSSIADRAAALAREIADEADRRLAQQLIDHPELHDAVQTLQEQAARAEPGFLSDLEEQDRIDVIRSVALTLMAENGLDSVPDPIAQPNRLEYLVEMWAIGDMEWHPGAMPDSTASGIPVELLRYVPADIRKPIAEQPDPNLAYTWLQRYVGADGKSNYQTSRRGGQQWPWTPPSPARAPSL